ncbi:Hypothetical predicted protein [Paramuricea clavata]|uniref:Uncharacterized protein n=1 Tax=Paramuricea clavata TaxID=317549 RepID=A0A6S7I0A5_PARCT|nr:Hypothetical predicted protein [Paramuricea clavata]
MLLEGLFICGQNEAIPLKSLSVRAFLQGYVVGFRSTLTYDNNTSNPLEVFFRTPVDDSYAVVGLEACIDGRKIRAEIQEKDKAREMYQEAISRGRTAAFGEEKKGDIFSLVLGNLPPGEKAVIQLTMVGELAVEPDGAVRFVLPTVLKPRYTPPGSTDPLAPESPTSGSGPVHHATGPPEYKFDMVINGAPGIAKVTSPSHEICVENNGQNINVSLAEDKQTDIVILVQPKEAHKPLVIIEPCLSNGENDFQKNTVVMVSFFPEFKGDTSCLQAACEFVFVIDRSGSMRGSYIQDASQTLLLFLKSIPEGCYFNVIGFGSSYVHLFPESVAYNQKNLEIAVKHAKNLQADLGGTELFDPLKDIFSHAPMKGLPRQVFVLTDGSIGNTESVIKLVAKNSNDSRCFSFGIGSGASSTLVKGIAEAGMGAAEFITSGERMQAKVIRSLKKAMQPAVTDTKVSYTVPDGVTVTTVPKSSLPAIFIGERLIVYAILHQSSPPTEVQEGSICLSGDLLGAKVEHNMKFQIPAAVTREHMLQVSTIHHLAAKKLIKEMELDLESGQTNSYIIQLSCDANVISSQTAFIAIDEERKEAVKGSLETWDIPQDDEWCGHSALPAVACFSLPSGGGGCVTVGASAPRSKKKSFGFSISKMSNRRANKYSASAPLDRERHRAKSAGFGGGFAEDQNISTKESTPTSPLTSIINLQLASGAWKMSAEMADVMAKSTAEMKNACPVRCEGDMETIWATVIVLMYLQIRQSNFRDEWELIAGKAQTWLTKQNLPEGCSIQVLREKAMAFLS